MTKKKSVVKKKSVKKKAVPKEPRGMGSNSILVDEAARMPDLSGPETLTDEKLSEILENSTNNGDLVWGPDVPLTGDDGVESITLEDSIPVLYDGSNDDTPSFEPDPPKDDDLAEVTALLKKNLISEVEPEVLPEPPPIIEVERPTRGHQQKIFPNKPVKAGGGHVRTQFVDVTRKGAKSNPLNRLEKTAQSTIRTGQSHRTG